MSFTGAELAVLEGGMQKLGVFLRLETDPITRLWLGIGRCDPGGDALDVDGASYKGAGELLNVPAFQQLTNGAAEVATFSLSGVTPEIVALCTANSEHVKGRRCYIGYGIQDERWALLGPVHWAWLTFADYISIEQRAQPNNRQAIVRTVSLAVSTAFAGRRRRGFSYWTDQDQQARAPGDTFCERTVLYTSTSDKTWPRF